MEFGKSPFTGIRRFLSGSLPWAALALLVFGVGAALGWSLLGSPAQRSNPDRFVYNEPVQLMHDQMHYRMTSGTIPTQSSENAPDINLPVTFHNFGAVKQSQVASWDFEIANRGNAMLVISSGYTTCGCTTAELSSADIPPGKSGLVTVYFDPQQASPGTVVRRGVILETNDPQHPQVEFWVQASVEK
jgi:hypothetical protein